MDQSNKYSHICRICFENQENGIFIFGDEGKDLYLQAKIRKYLYITITIDDKFPKIICDSCLKTLNGIHRFTTMAVKTQDKFNKLFSNMVSPSHVSEPKQVENRGLLHSYLTQGTTEKSSKDLTATETEVTEMEVRVDPMMILQYNDDFNSNTSAEEDANSTSSSEYSIEVLEEIAQKRKPYPCTTCQRRFTTQFALQNHVWGHFPHGRKVLTTNDNNKPKKIKTDPVFINDDKVEIATENSESINFSCPVCGKHISTKGNLKVHLETHRPKGKYGCDICGRIFKTQSNLYRHKEYHEGVQYPCSVCGRVYPTNSTLRAHSITHSNLRPHKCHVCDKTFKRNQDLKFHINQHTGARPYQCPYCPKAFASSGNCFSHRKRMHPQEVERDRERAAEIMR